MLWAGRVVVRQRELPGLRHRIRHACERGELVRVLAGTFVPVGLADDLAALCAAVCAHYRDAVIIGAAASALLGRGPVPAVISVATQGARVRSRGRFRFSRVRVPEALVCRVGEGIRVARVEHTAIVAAATDGGRQVFEALRVGVTCAQAVGDAWQVLRHRPGNGQRRRVVCAAVGNAWRGRGWRRRFMSCWRGRGLLGGGPTQRSGCRVGGGCSVTSCSPGWGC